MRPNWSLGIVPKKYGWQFAVVIGYDIKVGWRPFRWWADWSSHRYLDKQLKERSCDCWD